MIRIPAYRTPRFGLETRWLYVKVSMPHKEKPKFAIAVASIAAIIAVIGAILARPGPIEGSMSTLSKFISSTLGQAPASISIRDVRLGTSTPPPASDFRPDYVGVVVELAATNKGDQTASNCKGRLSFSNKYGDIYYADDKTNLNDKGWTNGTSIDVVGGDSETKIGFHFSVLPSVYNKEGSFRVACDRILTLPLTIRFPEMVGIPVSNGG
jgi:hypothetical protein